MTLAQNPRGEPPARDSTRRLNRRVLAVGLAAMGTLVAAVTVACSSPASPTASPTSSASVNAAAANQVPSAVGGLYVYPGSALLADATQLRFNGYDDEATELDTVAQKPQGIWLTGQAGEFQMVRQVTAAAAKAHAIPVLVAYNMPDRDACGKLSARNNLSEAAYEGWINQLTAAIGSGDDIVIVEPDALPDIVRECLSPSQVSERYTLLRYAMQHLGTLPHARVYLDAGNPGEITNPDGLIGPLEKAGIRYGRGFSANVSNFQWTANVVTWSQQLEHELGGSYRAVIDTSRNGSGPYDGPDSPQWCNPPGRALGVAPKLDPGPAGIDAYLWIKDPGASDGPCNGGPAAGDAWPKYALELEGQKP